MSFFNFDKAEAIRESQNDTPIISEEGLRTIAEAVVVDAALNEGLSSLEEGVEELVAEGVLHEKTVIRLDKEAKYNQALKITVLQMAKESNDPDFKKFVVVKKLEKKLEDKLMKKYASRANKIAKAAAQKWDPKKGRYKGTPEPKKK